MRTVIVRFNGWDVGCKSISFIRLVSELGEISLHEAKQMKESIIEGSEVDLVMPLDRAKELVKQATSLGFSGEVVDS
jgi:hypothetical protein